MRGRVAGPQQSARQRTESEGTIQRHVADEAVRRQAQIDALQGPLGELGEGVDANQDGIIDNQESIGSLSATLTSLIQNVIGTYEEALGTVPEKIKPYLTKLNTAIGTNNPPTGVRGRLVAIEEALGEPVPGATLRQRVSDLESVNANQWDRINALEDDVAALETQNTNQAARLKDLEDFRNRSSGFANRVAASGSTAHRHV